MSVRPRGWVADRVKPGKELSTDVVLSESYSSANVSIPVSVWRAKKDGPSVFVTAAIHGDEINGTGAIRHILGERPFKLVAGTLILVPVVNFPGFERHSRYLPDRRDLNRSFPGSSTGSLAARMAHSFFEQVVRGCQYGIDLHTAAVRRTNFPNVRADMSDERLAAFALAFGAELIVDGEGPKGSLRASGNAIGCATMILEAGEVWKVEPSVVEYAVRGVRNCLRHLKMVEGQPEEPAYRFQTDSTKWVRATHGGFLQFHVAPGDIVDEGQPLATNSDLSGTEQNIVQAPRDGIVLGMTTLPTVAPGDPICHLAFPKRGTLRRIERVVDDLPRDALHERIRQDLARSLFVTTPEGDDS